MSDYVPTDWVDNVTPVDATRMDKIEAGIDTADSIARAAQTVANAAIAKAIVDAAGDLIVGSAADVVQRLAKGTNGHVLTAQAAAPGVGWAALPASGAVDYENAWAAGTAYTPGDVVIYNGVEYIAVNPGTGQTPPAVATIPPLVIPLLTALPSSPFDGQEINFTNSLTSPNFVWRLRYVAAKASNKWVFLGGAPLLSEVPALESCAPGSYINLATVGPSITIPVAGQYVVEIVGTPYQGSGSTDQWMSYAIGATAAVDADAVNSYQLGAVGETNYMVRSALKTLTAVTLTMKYKTIAATASFKHRTMKVTPVAIG